MRFDGIIAAGALMGLAEAGVHKMKLQKIPLSKQLVSALHVYNQCAVRESY